VRDIREAYQLNESRACRLVGITRWINPYQSRRDPQEELRIRMVKPARYGFAGRT